MNMTSLTSPKMINMEKETLILIGIIVSIIGLWLAYRQYNEQKEIWVLQKQIHEHELQQIHNGKK